ncbi:MAG: TonB-dependent receptor [Acidobacteriota bacterium]
MLRSEGDDGLPLLRRPRWSGTWTLHGQLSEHISGDLTLVYVGTRDDVDPITYQRLSAPSYATGDIALAYSLWNGVEVTARALNVFDEESSEVLGYPAPGRRYFFGLRVGVDTPSRWRTTP